MDNSDQSNHISYDRPMFVLKYRTYKVATRVILWVLAGLFLSLLVGSRLKPSFGFTFLFGITFDSLIIAGIAFLIFHVAFVREIRLHSNRIVKIWKYLGPVQIRLADAKLLGSGPRKGFYDRNDTTFHLVANRVNYDESLADAGDVRRMNSLLADLSGRRVEEFQEKEITMNPLVKEE